MPMTLSSCAGVASDGPSASSIRRGSASGGYDFIDVRSNQQLPEADDVFDGSSAPPADPERVYTEAITGRDQLEILIADSDSGSPFHRVGSTYAYGPIEVPASGEVKTPYVPTLTAAGKQLADFSGELSVLVAKVSATADVSVRRVSRLAKRANILGNVRDPGAVEIDREGFSILDLVAQSGGTTGNEHLYVFHLRRDAEDYRYSAATLRRLDFFVQDGDLIRVESNPDRFFFVSGAVRRSGRFAFPSASPSLADALAVAGGLNDIRSDARGVFVYRAVESGRARVYGFDLEDPGSAHLVKLFRLSGQDTIYVSEAPLSEWNRLVKGILPFGNAMQSGAAASAGMPGL